MLVCGGGCCCFIKYGMVRESHVDKMAFEQRPEGSEGTSRANSWGKNFQTGNRKYKGPDSEAGWTHRRILGKPVWLRRSGQKESRSGRQLESEAAGPLVVVLTQKGANGVFGAEKQHDLIYFLLASVLARVEARPTAVPAIHQIR